MDNKPLISVIIPVYNVEQYLNECVESVLSQTYKNIEIILVDDGSTDASGKICDRFAEKYNFVQVIHQQNAGQSTARNVGFNASSGKFIYFLDSDDYIAGDALEKLCFTAEKDDCDIVFFDAHSFSDGNSFSVKQNYIRKNKYEVQKGIDVFSEMQKNGEYHSSVPLLFIKREFLENNNISFISGIYYEDMAFTFESLCLAETASQFSEALYYRRYRENSIMTSKKSKKYFESAVKLYEHIRDFAELRHISDNEAVKKYTARNAYNVFNNYEKLVSEDKNECKKVLASVKKDILKNNAYGDIALKMRCYHKLLWAGYKVYGKLSGR